MLVEPAIEAFATTYESGQSQIVYSKLIADLETPVSAMLKIAADRENCFLLESVEGGVTRGRDPSMPLARQWIHGHWQSA